MKQLFLVVAIVAVTATSASADLVLNASGTAENIDFTGFTGAGFTPGGGAGQLDSNTWSTTGFGLNVAFGGSETSGDPARGSSTGGEATGGVYSFDTGGGNAALGVQAGGSDFTPGSFILRISNGTGQTLTSFDVSYDVSIFNDQERSNSFNFGWSTDGVTVNPISSLDLLSAEAADASPAWVTSNQSESGIALPSLAPNAQFFVHWLGDDESGGGSRDEFALDNISITGFAAVPEPTTAVLFGLAGLGLCVVRRRS